MRIQARLLLFLFACASFSFWAQPYAQADADSSRKVCVLNYETPEGPVSKLLNKMFNGRPGVTFQSLALPIDFVNCIRDGSTEILIVGHALLTPETKDGKHPVQLAYFRNLEGDEREQAITSVIGQLDAQIEKLQASIASSDDSDQYDDTNDPDIEALQKLESKRKKYANYPANKPYYVVRPFLPQAMKLARQELMNEAAAGTLKLQKIRLMSCVPQEVLAEYDDLRGLLWDHGIQLDVAPPNKFMSMIEGIPVTSPSKKWLRESLPGNGNH